MLVMGEFQSLTVQEYRRYPLRDQVVETDANKG
jgi:hypothetical protein